MQPRDLGRTVLLCVIGGSADAISFLRYDTFVGAMTGNTVLLGIDLAKGNLDSAGFHLGIIATFLAAVIVTEIALKLKISPSLPLVLTALMLGGSELIANQWSAAICAAALGVQNAAVRSIAGVPINTVFITGNLLRLGTAVPEASGPQQQADAGGAHDGVDRLCRGCRRRRAGAASVRLSDDRAGDPRARRRVGRGLGRPSRARLSWARPGNSMRVT